MAECQPNSNTGENVGIGGIEISCISDIARDGLAWFCDRFNAGCSIQLALFMYIIVIILLVIVQQSRLGDHCVYRLDDPGEDSLWKFLFDNFRGGDYFIDNDDPNMTPEKLKEKQAIARSCPLTYWGVFHYFMYVAFGFICPKFFWQFFLISIAFEGMEFFGGCHCVLDLVWNFLGLVTGVALRQYFFPIY